MSLVWLFLFAIVPRTTCWIAFLYNAYRDGLPKVFPVLFIEAGIVLIIAQFLIALDIYTWYRFIFYQKPEKLKKPYDDCRWSD
ncbi:MAG: hypothetical protein ACRCX2_25605 [Paraclostridium sp.]